MGFQISQKEAGQQTTSGGEDQEEEGKDGLSGTDQVYGDHTLCERGL